MNNMSDRRVVCGCFGTIYYAKILKNGMMSDVNRVDVTDDALTAVADHIIQMREYEENDGYSGYNYHTKGNKSVNLVVYDEDKYQLVKKINEVSDDVCESGKDN